MEGLTVVLPPLRARREDIAPLFLSFLRRYAPIGAPEVETKLLEALCLYDWPLNVRELLLLARRLLSIHGHQPILRKLHLPAHLVERRAPGPVDGDSPPLVARPARRPTDDEAEFEALVEALRGNGGSVARAAASLGMNRSRAYRLLGAHPAFSLDDVRW